MRSCLLERSMCLRIQPCNCTYIPLVLLTSVPTCRRWQRGRTDSNLCFVPNVRHPHAQIAMLVYLTGPSGYGHAAMEPRSSRSGRANATSTPPGLNAVDGEATRGASLTGSTAAPGALAPLMLASRKLGPDMLGRHLNVYTVLAIQSPFSSHTADSHGEDFLPLVDPLTYPEHTGM